MPNTNYERHFGIELEFNAGTHYCATAHSKLCANGFEDLYCCNGYGHSSGQRWEIKTDSSAGLEIASKKLKANQEGLNELYNRVSIINKTRVQNGWTITDKCGFHVHVDISDLNPLQVRNLIKLCLAFEPVILGLQPKSRDGNTYARRIANNQNGAGKYWDRLAMKRLTESEFKRCIEKVSENRYQGVNFNYYLLRQSVEFRYGAGTLHPDKVRSWVLFLLAIVEKAKQSEFCAPFILDEKPLKQVFQQALKCFANLRKAGIKDGVTKAKKDLVERFEHFSGGRHSAQNMLVKHVIREGARI